MSDQLEIKLLDMMMELLHIIVHATSNTFNTLADVLALVVLVRSQLKSMRLLSYMFWWTCLRWTNTSSNTRTLILQSIIHFCIFLWLYAYLLYFPSKFEKAEWKGWRRPTPEQLRELGLKGWKGMRGERGSNFFEWFKEVILLSLFKLSNVPILHANNWCWCCLMPNILWFS